MPLPAPNSPWPPPELEVPSEDVRKWAAWWGGDPERLSQVYGGSHTTTEQSFSQRGGLYGAIQRFFWGQPATPGEQRSKLHVPLAAEIAQVSADLLFGQPPQIVVDEDQATQDRIDDLLGERVHTQLHDAAEAGAALGHTYLRVGWDLDIDSKRPLFDCVDADAAFPIYRYGRLIEVTFVREFDQGGGVILRHLEHHTRGLIEHALYLGDTRNLGRVIPLTEAAQTADLAESVQLIDDGRQGVPTGLDMLTVIGVPNARSRTWRHIPNARDLGRADISGVESELDALDDTWSSWMRDIRHGRSRLHVPHHYLESNGPGAGARLNLERELYIGLNAMAGEERMEITAIQLAIRWQEHLETALALTERIAAGAGYSPQTFGLQDQAALTAMESWSRQTRTQNTRSSKIRRWRRALVDLTQLTLAVDRVHFGGSGNPELTPEVSFPNTVSESQSSLAQTAQLFRAAEAASTETIVRMMHPDWDDQQIEAEVKLILDERQAMKNATAAMVRGEESDEADDEAESGAEPRARTDEAVQQEQRRGAARGTPPSQENN